MRRNDEMNGTMLEQINGGLIVGEMMGDRAVYTVYDGNTLDALEADPIGVFASSNEEIGVGAFCKAVKYAQEHSAGTTYAVLVDGKYQTMELF